MLTIGKRYVVYRTNGERGVSRTSTVIAVDSEDARRLVEQKYPGWRVYGVQLGLDDEIA